MKRRIWGNFFDYYMDMVFFFTSLKKEIQFFFAENILNLKLNTKMLENVMANMLVVKICLSCWKFYFKFKEAHTENVFLTKSFSFADNYFNIWFLADEKIFLYIFYPCSFQSSLILLVWKLLLSISQYQFQFWPTNFWLLFSHLNKTEKHLSHINCPKWIC